MAAQQPLGVFAEGAVAAGLTALALDARRVAALTTELGHELAILGLEGANVDRLAHTPDYFTLCPASARRNTASANAH
jgi:hypothetical protein